jgi:hypothetical protein
MWPPVRPEPPISQVVQTKRCGCSQAVVITIVLPILHAIWTGQDSASVRLLFLRRDEQSTAPQLIGSKQ